MLEIISTLNQITVQLEDLIAHDSVEIDAFLQTMIGILKKMEPALDDLAQQKPALSAHLLCKNAQYSLSNIQVLRQTDPQAASRRIEYELLPLIQEFYVDFYFWGFCYPDPKKMKHYYENDMKLMCPIRGENQKAPSYPYDVSVVVLAYNKLEYTKQCIEHLKAYFPAHINHELILVNNGSSDGTKAFFESVKPDKQIDILHNTKSVSILSRIIEGKYVLFISNDILIMPHAVENLLACLESDASIGCVVPTCPNISNLQPIPHQYKSKEEMIAFAEQNNQSDPFRWEQRSRLVPPAMLARSNEDSVHAFFGYHYPFYSEKFLAFSDDLMSMLMRRKGVRCMLANDAFVHHFGSVTLKEETSNAPLIYEKGRQAFLHVFSIDPWGTGMCFSPDLITALSLAHTTPVNILGVNCGVGGNPLKIKHILAQQQRNKDQKIYNITDHKEFYKDLVGVSDHFAFIEDWDQADSIFPHTEFDYIIAEDINSKIHSIEGLKKLYARLMPGGEMAIKAQSSHHQNELTEAFTSSKKVNTWTIIQKSL